MNNLWEIIYDQIVLMHKADWSIKEVGARQLTYQWWAQLTLDNISKSLELGNDSGDNMFTRSKDI